MITIIGAALLLSPIALLAYAALIYPAMLWLIVRRRGGGSTECDSVQTQLSEWPVITITVPAFNEARSIRSTLNSLLQLDYPVDRRQILVISDASTDATDDIVREFAHAGVELLRLAERGGKTAAENASAAVARGEIIVNIDASVRVGPASLKPLIAAFRDPTVGVASGRDLSIGAGETEGNSAEGGYVGYEMWVRGLETRVYSIVGASGCFFATRKVLFNRTFPQELSRDFASALIAREAGYRAVSVDDAVCMVPRTRSLRSEYARKVRTMARGLATLQYMRHMLNPEVYGVFAWMLFSHKLCRWLFYPALLLAAVGGALLISVHPWLGVIVAVGGGVLLVGAGAALAWPAGRKLPRLLSLIGYAVVSNLAGAAAWWRFLSGERMAVWAPTQRPA